MALRLELKASLFRGLAAGFAVGLPTVLVLAADAVIAQAALKIRNLLNNGRPSNLILDYVKPGLKRWSELRRLHASIVFTRLRCCNLKYPWMDNFRVQHLAYITGTGSYQRYVADNTALRLAPNQQSPRLRQVAT